MSMKYDMRESLKGNLIVVLLLLLFLICFGLINAQEQVVTKSRPGDPTLPYVISFTQPATGGNLIITLSGGSPLTGGQTVQSGQMVMVGTTPSTGYLPALGYPKVYRTGTPTDVVSTTITEGARIFKMPTFPVTVEMKYDQVPSGENRLKAVSYTIDDKATTLSNFSSGILTYDITLPTGSTGPVTLTGTRMDGETDVTTTVTPNGSNKVTATLTVTPQSGASKTYTFNFTVAPSESSIVTISSGLAGGTITATLADGKVVKSGDAVANNTVLTLSNTPLKGYDFGAYTVTEGVNLSDDNTVTVSKAVAISATFTAQEEIIPEKIGTPAIPQQPSGGDPIPSENDAPVVIISDAGALPPDTELSALRLVKDEATEDNQTKVKELATAESLKPDNMQIMEITLVKVVTTTDGATGQETTTVTPVQPGDKVRVRIPYPAGQNKDKADFTVIHLKSDGTTQKYTVAGGNLSLLADYMELTIASFSPFGIAWTPKSDPTPPSYVPTYYNVILPATEGVTFNKKPANIQ